MQMPYQHWRGMAMRVRSGIVMCRGLRWILWRGGSFSGALFPNMCACKSQNDCGIWQRDGQGCISGHGL